MKVKKWFAGTLATATFMTTLAILAASMLAGCGKEKVSSDGGAKAETKIIRLAEANESQRRGDEEVSLKLKITVGDKILTATMEDNATTRAFLQKLPATLPMENLYGREMCYHYGAGGLATSATRDDRYEVGDIIYWPPRGSFVILFKQNGEEFERVQLGHIDQDVSFFEDGADMEILFEAAQ